MSVAATILFGLALVTDGDTLRINGQPVRLSGIDAPERRQTCGTATGRIKCGDLARVRLGRIIAGRPVRCEGRERDRWRRLIATCKVGGQDLGSIMVREGWAMAYRRYSLRYVPEELAARKARRGIWATTFESPSDFRR